MHSPQAIAVEGIGYGAMATATAGWITQASTGTSAQVQALLSPAASAAVSVTGLTAAIAQISRAVSLSITFEELAAHVDVATSKAATADVSVTRYATVSSAVTKAATVTLSIEPE